MARTPRMDGEAEYAQGRIRNSSLPTLFIIVIVLQLVLYQWPRRWLVSGAPILTLCILQGEATGNRVLPFVHVWPLLATVNLAYAVASTSWLLYWVFTALCYLTIFFTCLFQFRIIGIFTRLAMRAIMRQLHFIDDKIALFDIPALEIDTEVDGLMVLRGLTFSLSTLSFVLHGIEVGVKLSDDMELAIRTEKITVSLFRRIEIGDCFANLKGGEYEMTIGSTEGKTKDEDGDALFVAGTCFLKTASTKPEVVKMKSEMTDGSPPEDSSPQTAMKSMKQYLSRSNSANGKYRQILQFIDNTSTIHQSREHIKHTGDSTDTLDPADKNGLRAAICSQIHSKPSIPHPPRRSIKVSTLRNLSSPWVKRFMHRLPMLLRLLLNPISYFHPVKVSSITATASGRWIEAMLVQNIFRDYGDSNTELQQVKTRVSAWLSGSNFVVELCNFVGLAQVPLIPSYNINCRLACDGVFAYRALPGQASPSQVISLGGADGTVIVPTFLLPHHEHLLPPVPTNDSKQVPEERVRNANGKPREIHLKKAEKDESAAKFSVHARLPAIFDQELLDFIAMIVRASKLVEIEQVSTPIDEDGHKLSEFTGALNQKMKGGLKKAIVANDRWLAKLVGKMVRKLEDVRGDLGYSGDIVVELSRYRNAGWLEEEGEKLLP